jgi:hypothetical protein
MIDKKSYVNNIKVKIQQLQKEQDQFFKEMVDKLKISNDDKDIFFDYCYNNFEFEEGKNIIKKYIE